MSRSPSVFRSGLAGFDINGWHDRAMRDWSLDASGLAHLEPNGYLVDAGMLGCTVEVGTQEPTTRVAGPQARLAPHGRGAGWGQRGAPSLRSHLRGKLETEDLALTVAALAHRPQIGVLPIPDTGSMTDEVREARLAALRKAQVRQPMLAWSSVLLCLTAIDAGYVQEGMRVGTFELGDNGFRLQTLEIRPDRLSDTGLLVPKRKQVGIETQHESGLFNRERASKKIIVEASGLDRLKNIIDFVDLPGRLALSSPGFLGKDLVRYPNGDWVEIQGTSPKLVDEFGNLELLDTCDLVLVHTPGDPGLTQELTVSLAMRVQPDVREMNPEAVARGALLAAERLRHGHPIWYDFLPRIETIVLQDNTPHSLSLVPDNADVEAGRIWESEHPISLRWPGGSDELRVWLRKEDVAEARRAPAVVSEAPTQTVEVALSLKQAPAQERAEVTITSRDWVALRERPAVVRWSEAKPDERSWEEILEAEAGPRPSIPKRVVLPGDARMWTEDGADLSRTLRRYRRGFYTPIFNALGSRKRLDWASPQHDLSSRKYYCISSDGERPTGVEDVDWGALLDVLGDAESDLRKGDVKNNHAFGVLSWVFRLCPDAVGDIALQVLQTQHHGMRFPGWNTIFPQGLGRIAKTDNAFADAIAYLDELSGDWNMNQQACASFLLSRNDRVFDLMQSAHIDRWTEQTARLLDGQLRDMTGQKFRYLPTLIAGLLRWRLREPDAYTFSGDSERSNIIAPRLDRIMQRVEEIPTAQQKPHLQSYADLRSFFDDEGGNPDILISLFDRT